MTENAHTERLAKQLAEAGFTTPAWLDRCQRCDHVRWEHGLYRKPKVCSAFQAQQNDGTNEGATA